MIAVKLKSLLLLPFVLLILSCDSTGPKQLELLAPGEKLSDPPDSIHQMHIYLGPKDTDIYCRLGMKKDKLNIPKDSLPSIMQKFHREFGESTSLYIHMPKDTDFKSFVKTTDAAREAEITRKHILTIED